MSTPINRKNKLFGYRPESPTLKKISANKIKEPIIKDRFDFEVDSNEFEHLGDIPLEVAYSHESTHYIITKGLRIFYEGKQHKKMRKYRCLVVGEVDHDHETITARLNHVLATVWPFHILEQTRAICQIVELLDDTYNHGGNRRGKRYKKQSAIDILCKQFPHKRTRIDDLKRFSELVSLLGIEGLYYLLMAHKKELSISLIHHANPILRKMRMRAKIDRKVREMQDNGHDKVEIIEEIGIMVFDVFFGHEKRTYRKKSKAIDDKSNPKGPKNNEGKPELQRCMLLTRCLDQALNLKHPNILCLTFLLKLIYRIKTSPKSDLGRVNHMTRIVQFLIAPWKLIFIDILSLLVKFKKKMSFLDSYNLFF